jgi:hypothetical protein
VSSFHLSGLFLLISIFLDAIHAYLIYANNTYNNYYYLYVMMLDLFFSKVSGINPQLQEYFWEILDINTLINLSPI